MGWSISQGKRRKILHPNVTSRGTSASIRIMQKIKLSAMARPCKSEVMIALYGMLANGLACLSAILKYI